MEQQNYNLLYRWTRRRSPKNASACRRAIEKFMTLLLNHPQVKPLLSDEHFSVDGTLRAGAGGGILDPPYGETLN